MFSALCRRLLPLALGTGFVFAAAPAFSALGDTASSQARHIATVFPGRMTGTPPEMLSADYLRQQFALMGIRATCEASIPAISLPTAISARTGITPPAVR